MKKVVTNSSLENAIEHMKFLGYKVNIKKSKTIKKSKQAKIYPDFTPGEDGIYEIHYT